MKITSALTGKKINKYFLIFILGFFVSCITVNVNFPEGAVQQATDNYVRDLYRAKERGDEKKTSESPKSGFLLRAPGSLEKLPFNRVTKFTLRDYFFNKYSFGFLSAHAQVKFVVNSQVAQKIKENQRSRIQKIDKYKKKGVLGESEEGLLVIKSKKLRPLQKKKVQKIIDEENKDRKKLYKEIAKINNTSEDVVVKSFSKSFQSNSPKGTWIQKDSQWTQK